MFSFKYTPLLGLQRQLYFAQILLSTLCAFFWFWKNLDNVVARAEQ